MRTSPADLFDRHHLTIFRYVFRMTGRRDIADDLTQEVFVRVVRRWDDYEDTNRERAWLFRIARNLITDWRRAESRGPLQQFGLVEPAHDLDQDLTLDVRKAVECFALDDRDVFLLRTLGGFGHEEIADLVGISPAAVRSRIFRARSALRSRLAGSRASAAVELRGVST